MNPSLALVSIPLEAFEYRLGNCSTPEPVIDQHKMSADKRSGITAAPEHESSASTGRGVPAVGRGRRRRHSPG